MNIDDNAVAVFEASVARAERMSRLYHGLVDIRSRNIRADWAQSFEDFMKWNRGTACGRVDGHDAIVVIKSHAELSTADFKSEELRDLLRASLVMGVSAMDAYFHRKIRFYVVRMAKKGEAAPGELKKQTLTVSDFAIAMGRDRRWGELGRILERKLGFQSLQSPSGIERGLSWIGITGFWAAVAGEIDYDVDTLKKHVNWIVSRRNKIAHEGDLSTAKKNFGNALDLSPANAEWSLELIRKIVTAAEKIINQQIANA